MKPRLSRKARVRPDPRDGRPVLLSPERGFRLSDTAAAIVALCDGTRDVEAIVSELATRYGAPPPASGTSGASRASGVSRVGDGDASRATAVTPSISALA